VIMLYIGDCIVASSAHTSNRVIASGDTGVGTVYPEAIINFYHAIIRQEYFPDRHHGW